MKIFELDQRDPGLYNAAINGNMDFWQRGTTITRTQASNSTGYLADRWRFSCGPTATKSVVQSRSTSIPTTFTTSLLYSNEIVSNTAVASFTGSDHILPFHTYIEGNIFQPLIGKGFTVGFWLFSSQSIANFPISLNNGPVTFSYVTHISVASGWNYYSVVIPWHGSLDNYSNSAACLVNFGFIGGPTHQLSTLDTWLSATGYTHSTSTNYFATAGVTLRITQVQVRSGQWSSADMQNSFQRTGVNFAQELHLCQRYYEKSYDIDTAPATATLVGAVQFISRNSNSEQQYLAFKVHKRATPTVNAYSGNNGVINNAFKVAGSVNTAWLSENPGQGGTGWQSAITTIDIIRYHWTADADF